MEYSLLHILLLPFFSGALCAVDVIEAEINGGFCVTFFLPGAFIGTISVLYIILGFLLHLADILFDTFDKD